MQTRTANSGTGVAESGTKVSVRGVVMEWQMILAAALIFPIVLFPTSFVWYIDIGGVCAIVREKRATKGRAKS